MTNQFGYDGSVHKEEPYVFLVTLSCPHTGDENTFVVEQEHILPFYNTYDKHTEVTVATWQR